MSAQISPGGREQVIQVYMATHQCDHATAEAAVDAALQEATSQAGENVSDQIRANGSTPQDGEAPATAQVSAQEQVLAMKTEDIPLWDLPEWTPKDDHDAARIIKNVRPGELHYAVGTGTWYVWDGKCHRPDTSGEVGRVITRITERWGEWVREMQRRAEAGEVTVERSLRYAGHLAAGGLRSLSPDELAKVWKDMTEARSKYVAGLRRTAGHSALAKMLSVACSVDDSEMDERHPRWLNCANGTVDLETGQVKPHNPADMLTYCLPLEYRPEAASPLRFLSLVHRMCGGDASVAEYLLKVLGYALIGENPEQMVFFINGPTKSGKTLLLYIARQLLGPLAAESQAELITVVRHGRNARTENSVRGKRLVTITETSGFMTIDEGQLKRITGEPVIAVDQHYAKQVLKTPVTWAIITATNDMPSLTNFDDAMRERIAVIPGGPTIPVEQRDKRLAEKILATEADGILRLLVKGCIEYHRSGLAMPVAVQIETDRYRGEQNSVANFLADCCIVSPPGAGWAYEGVRLDVIPMTQAWRMYQSWARGESHLGRNEFYAHMASQPGVSRNDNGGSVRQFEGIRWNAETEKRLESGVAQ